MDEKLIMTQWLPCQLYRCSSPTEQFYCSYAGSPSALKPPQGGALLTRDIFHQRDEITLGKRCLCCLAENTALTLLKAQIRDGLLQRSHVQENVRKLPLVRKSLKMLSFPHGKEIVPFTFLSTVAARGDCRIQDLNQSQLSS